jgi:hypothetical protein
MTDLEKFEEMFKRRGIEYTIEDIMAPAPDSRLEKAAADGVRMIFYEENPEKVLVGKRLEVGNGYGVVWMSFDLDGDLEAVEGDHA